MRDRERKGEKGGHRTLERAHGRRSRGRRDLAGPLPSISSVPSISFGERYSSTHERQVTRRIADHRDRERRTANFIISSRPRFFVAARISPRSQESRGIFRPDNELCYI